MPAIAIVGRQNVGKSSLFNCLIGKRKSIVYGTPGVTRDLITERVPWGEGRWTLTDFPGFEREKEVRTDALTLAAIRAAEKQLEKYHLILFVVARSGLSSYEYDLAERLRRLKKPVWLVVNFVDDPQLETEGAEFFRLGFPETFFVSALNRRNIQALRERIQEYFSGKKAKPTPREELPRPDLRLVVLGKPNAGKSTLFNRLVGKERALVSPVPGTTRDTVGEFFHYEHKLVELLDTAGLRRQSRIHEDLERISGQRTTEALENCDVAFLLIDFTEVFDQQNKALLNRIAAAGKPVVVLVNKYDLFRHDAETKAQIAARLAEVQKRFWQFPWFFVSALSGENCRRALAKAFALKALFTKVGTPQLNRILAELTHNPILANHGIKLKYITQGEPANRFILFANKPVPIPVRRYLTQALAQKLGWQELPLLLDIRQKI
ncbi:MAG: ribosome biogenesis GTPase Der [Turneriella sp.]|nr:ribosome biogenesis GTPase Der [Turneriella sp.]